ncbi:MAG: hypothetical protein RMI30_01450 [Thermodesulfovibrio sp.]|nr:hypothetical protein [Thermodesulfovibrio sp.]MDW7998109.1 hypothetical protein [Thermodesulfovibrio sp.]
MKKIIKICIIIFSILILYSFSHAQRGCDPNTREAKEDEVIFFENINYGGCWMGAKAGSNYASLVGNSLGLLKLAKELGNISQSCKIFG